MGSQAFSLLEPYSSRNPLHQVLYGPLLSTNLVQRKLVENCANVITGHSNGQNERRNGLDKFQISYPRSYTDDTSYESSDNMLFMIMTREIYGEMI